MRQKVIVVGAGLIGASIGLQLQRQGADVTFVEAGLPASAASGRSFGWINAGFYLDQTHHHLRAEAMAAWHRLHRMLPKLALEWCGCLSWDISGDELEARQGELSQMGYPVERWDRARIADAVPMLASNVQDALWLPGEGVAEAGVVTRQLLRAAQTEGAQLMTGTRVVGLSETGGRVSGVTTQSGPLQADNVILAAGTGARALLAPLDVALPMLTRPGAIMQSRPVARVLDRVMVSPDLEFRQDGEGRILAPTAGAHQSDDSDMLDAAPDELAHDTMMRLQRWLPDVEISWERITLAMRPVPGDGRPVVGPCGPAGLSVAVMHSGVTLGALMGELVAQEVLSGEASDWLTPYRPQRFAAAGAN